LPEYTDYAIDILRNHEDAMRDEFHEFFKSIRIYVETEHKIITGPPY
jgi:hypothetical protein